jgi:hypothetical protein
MTGKVLCRIINPELTEPPGFIYLFPLQSDLSRYFPYFRFLRKLIAKTGYQTSSGSLFVLKKITATYSLLNALNLTVLLRKREIVLVF